MRLPNSPILRSGGLTIKNRLRRKRFFITTLNKPLPQQAPTFADNSKIEEYAYNAIGQMQATGIIGGVGSNMFDPTGTYTREQSITTMVRLFRIVAG